PAALGDSSQLKVGDSVLAIGSPLGLDGSVTLGIVSALDRTLTVGGEQQQTPPGWPQQGSGGVTTIGGAIQTDAAINPGNSGGALVNAAGQVVGINTAIATAGANGNIGLGFAIPINTAKHVSDQLIKTGKVTHAFLGVSVTDATGDTPGALIRQITEGSPAEKAGLQVADLITKINGKAVDGGDDVVGQIRGFKPGQEVQITYVRDGQEPPATATLAEMQSPRTPTRTGVPARSLRTRRHPPVCSPGTGSGEPAPLVPPVRPRGGGPGGDRPDGQHH